MIGVIQEIEDKGNNVRLKVANRWYSSPLKDLLSMKGAEIIFEPSESQYNGKTYYWINAYQMSDAPAAMRPPPGPSYAQPPVGTPQQPSVSVPHMSVPQQAPTPPKPTIDPQSLLPMTSNLVAHAIQAGKIQSPEEIDAWAQAAFRAAKRCMAPEDEFGDDIPF